MLSSYQALEYYFFWKLHNELVIILSEDEKNFSQGNMELSATLVSIDN